MTGRGWYEFKGDADETIIERDRQLASLFDWLREANSVERLNIR